MKGMEIGWLQEKKSHNYLKISSSMHSLKFTKPHRETGNIWVNPYKPLLLILK